MRYLLEFRSNDPDEETVIVEVEEPEEVAGPERVARWRRSNVVERADTTLEAAFDRIRPAATALIDRMQALPRQPDQITVEFGVRFSGKAGAIIAAAEAEANFRVSLLWLREQASEKPKNTR